MWHGWHMSSEQKEEFKIVKHGERLIIQVNKDSHTMRIPKENESEKKFDIVIEPKK